MATERHDIFIGDKIQRALEIIGEESDELESWETLNAYADGDIQPEAELIGNYLHVKIDTEELE